MLTELCPVQNVAMNVHSVHVSYVWQYGHTIPNILGGKKIADVHNLHIPGEGESQGGETNAPTPLKETMTRDILRLLHIIWCQVWSEQILCSSLEIFGPTNIYTSRKGHGEGRKYMLPISRPPVVLL